MARKIRPMGTGPGVFGAYGNEVSVVFAGEGGVGTLIIHYDNEEHAITAMQTLREKLDTDDPVTVQLRHEYSIAHLQAFLQEFLPEDGLEFVERPALVVVDCIHGLRERIGPDDFAALNLEQLLRPLHMIEWEQDTPVEGGATLIGQFAMQRLGLDEGYSYWSKTTVMQRLSGLEDDNDDEAAGQ